MSKNVFQFTGLSGVGKSTLSAAVSEKLMAKGYQVTVLDGDELRKTISADLGFSEEDRLAHLTRVAQLAASINTDVILIAVINPYEKGRQVFRDYANAKLIWLRCGLAELKKRDTKGLYHRAYLPDGHPDKLTNLTGVNAPFEKPMEPDLVIDTDHLNITDASAEIGSYILKEMLVQQRFTETI
ncbi:adenylyl-sulfate kinase [Pedobacter nanyangensis]|jgi:adenylylsulfate kinase|uniref:adenylyl-sulfate kinase n=1 Tax=Pedobacter nanyangensis TaxID=1562389 RepID=UPI000DE46981|nr:adenylyl-sulfate kinase [Pedobacter nanyangensis]